MKHGRPDYEHIQDPTGKIPEDEPVFLLRAQDKTAAATVLYWASLNAKGDGREVALALVRAHARKMEEWPTKKVADV